jgi:carbon-monoxide dehydrogenase medium subunit
MRRLQLVEPTTLKDAVAALGATADAKAIAGGTALLVLIKQGVYVPSTLVSLKKVRDGDYVDLDPARGLRVGALTTIFDVESHPLVRRHYPVLADAAHKVANIRIRNMATLGGNLAHGDYQSDPPAVLVALGASVVLLGPRGERAMPLDAFLRGAYETALKAGELLKEIQVPATDPSLRGTYLKFTTRSVGDRPCAAVAAFVRQRNGTVDEVRVVVGAVSPVPVRLTAVEESLRGGRLTPAALAEAQRLTGRALEPVGDLRGSEWYRQQVVPVLVRRVLEHLGGISG